MGIWAVVQRVLEIRSDRCLWFLFYHGHFADKRAHLGRLRPLCAYSWMTHTWDVPLCKLEMYGEEKLYSGNMYWQSSALSNKNSQEGG